MIREVFPGTMLRFAPHRAQGEEDVLATDASDAPTPDPDAFFDDSEDAEPED